MDLPSLCLCYKCLKSFTKRNYKLFYYPCRGGCGKIICDPCSQMYGIEINELGGFDSDDENEIKYQNEHTGEDSTFLCEECFAIKVIL